MPELVKTSIPVTPDEIPDDIIREKLLPFARRCYGIPVKIPEDVYREMKGVYDTYIGKSDCGQSALTYEAAALANLAYDHAYWTSPLQKTYEDAFFDIRYCLNDTQAVVNLVFTPLFENNAVVDQEIEGKVIAYTLGFEHFLRWMKHDETTEVHLLMQRLGKLKAFRASMEELNLPAREALAKAYCQLIQSTQHGKPWRKGDGILEHLGWSMRLERLICDCSSRGRL